MTLSQSKELFTVWDRPAIQYIIEESISAGIDEICIIVSSSKSAIKEHLDKINFDASIYYITQREPRGLPDAIYTAKGFLRDDMFAVLLPDDVLVDNYNLINILIRLYKRFKRSIIAVHPVEGDDVSKYGIVDCGGSDASCAPINHIVEKPTPADAPSNLAVIGRYVFEPDIVPYLKNADNLAISISRLIPRGVYAYTCDSLKRYDIGSPSELLRANIDFYLAHHPNDSERLFTRPV